MFKQNEDFFITYVDAQEYNKLWEKYEYNKEEEIKFPLHNNLHKISKENNNTMLHVVDNFWKQKEWIHKKAPWGDQTIYIDEFCTNGEINYLSISLAAFLAKDAYLEHFRLIQMKLKISIPDKKGYDHQPTPKKLKEIFAKMKEKGISENDISKYCKKEKLQKYYCDLKNYLSKS